MVGQRDDLLVEISAGGGGGAVGDYYLRYFCKLEQSISGNVRERAGGRDRAGDERDKGRKK